RTGWLVPVTNAHSANELRPLLRPRRRHDADRRALGTRAVLHFPAARLDRHSGAVARCAARSTKCVPVARARRRVRLHWLRPDLFCLAAHIRIRHRRAAALAPMALADYRIAAHVWIADRALATAAPHDRRGNERTVATRGCPGCPCNGTWSN